MFGNINNNKHFAKCRNCTVTDSKTKYERKCHWRKLPLRQDDDADWFRINYVHVPWHFFRCKQHFRSSFGRTAYTSDVYVVDRGKCQPVLKSNTLCIILAKCCLLIITTANKMISLSIAVCTNRAVSGAHRLHQLHSVNVWFFFFVSSCARSPQHTEPYCWLLTQRLTKTIQKFPNK